VTDLAKARLLALLLPASLMAGALGSQYIGGLFPCEMCHWQRWPHYAAIALAVFAFLAPGRNTQLMLVRLAGVAILVSGAIGVFHAGVEYGWWEGPTQCTATLAPGDDTLSQIMATPLIRCDQPQWTFFGISLAGFNAFFSLTGGLIILWLSQRSRRAA
jgi:disulfide bond formation protein DsbB